MGCTSARCMYWSRRRRRLYANECRYRRTRTSAFGEKTDNADSAATTGVDAEQSENPDAADHAEENADVAAVEETPIPTPEVDKAAAEKEKQEAEANAMSDQNPRIYLKDYLIKVPVGTSVVCCPMSVRSKMIPMMHMRSGGRYRSQVKLILQFRGHTNVLTM